MSCLLNRKTKEVVKIDTYPQWTAMNSDEILLLSILCGSLCSFANNDAKPEKKKSVMSYTLSLFLQIGHLYKT